LGWWCFRWLRTFAYLHRHLEHLLSAGEPVLQIQIHDDPVCASLCGRSDIVHDFVESADERRTVRSCRTEFRYDRSPVGGLHGNDPGHVIYMGSASKSLAPRLRLGWLVVPDRLVDAVGRQRGETEETSGFVDQLAMAKFIVAGSYDRHIRTMRAEYRRRREQLVIAVAQSSPTPTVTGMPAGCT
jgi:hypothetical protein